MDFVNRLVERTRERQPAIRPVIGASPEGGPAEALPVLDVEREIVPLRARVDERRDAPAMSAVHEASPEPASEVHRAEPRHALAPAPPALPAPLVVEVSAPAGVAVASAAAAPSIDAHRSAAESTPRDLGMQTIVTSAPDHRRSMASDARGAAPPARTSDGPSEQVIRVHIGRIDVRAPAAAVPPSPAPRRPAEPLPSVALGRYLDDRGRRR